MMQEQENVYYYITVMNENYRTRPSPRAARPEYSKACIC